jgi:hypothetical protein
MVMFECVRLPEVPRHTLLRKLLVRVDLIGWNSLGSKRLVAFAGGVAHAVSSRYVPTTVGICMSEAAAGCNRICAN